MRLGLSERRDQRHVLQHAAPRELRALGRATPDDFVFALKGPRYPHPYVKRLNEPVAPLGNFFASGVLRLGAKLGPILWQLPPSFRFDRDKLDAFFRLLPRDTEAAAALRPAARPSAEGAGVAAQRTRRRPMRHAWKSVTRASAIPPSSSCCASTTSPWSAPTRSNGRC